MKLPLAAAVCLLSAQALCAQPTMPAWLAPYPGAAPQAKSYPALVVHTYSTDAAPDLVSDHYRKLFEAQNLVFHPNADGIGVTVRATVPECDLLITIRPQENGASVNVNCAVSTPTGSAPMPTRVITGGQAAIMERHQQRVAEMGIHRQREDAPAPLLVWPDWLVHVSGGRLSSQAAVDQSGNQYLHARYTSSVPMTQLFAFYKDLLTAHEYEVYRGRMSTGQTQKGVQQNALGEVEGGYYPNGFPGPRAEIRVTFDRSYLNQPITVSLKLTTFAYKAPARF